MRQAGGQCAIIFRSGLVAQWESARLTRERSLVQNQPGPPGPHHAWCGPFSFPGSALDGGDGAGVGVGPAVGGAEAQAAGLLHHHRREGPGPGAEHVAVAQPMAELVVDQILRSGYVMRGFLGITPFNVTDSIREQLNLPVADGVIIAGVVKGFPADESGLQTEDVIVMLNKTAIENSGDLSKFLLNNPPGSNVEVSFYRNGELRKVELVLADKPN